MEISLWHPLVNTYLLWHHSSKEKMGEYSKSLGVGQQGWLYHWCCSLLRLPCPFLSSFYAMAALEQTTFTLLTGGAHGLEVLVICRPH